MRAFTRRRRDDEDIWFMNVLKYYRELTEWMKTDHMTPGQIAYNAYKAKANDVSLVSGAALPVWEDMDEAIRDAWEAAASAVLKEGF